MTSLPHERAVIDVSKLPSVTFGRRSMSWWASMGFIAIEGTTLAVILSSYLYLRTNSAEWPPTPVMSPDLLVPTVNLVLIVLSVWPAYRMKKRAKSMDRDGVQRWLMVVLAMAVITTALRGFEFDSLNVRWDANAYGSALWGIYVAHTFLMIGDVLESGVMLYFYVTGNNTQRHFSDVEDGADYQYFLTASWILCYLVAVVGPRIY